MGFEEHMIEGGFNNEMTYIDYLMEMADKHYEYMSQNFQYNNDGYSIKTIEEELQIENVPDMKEYSCIIPFASYIYKGQLAMIKNNNNGKVGIINRNGDFIIPCIYDSLSYGSSSNIFCSNNDILIASLNNKFGCINLSGKIILPFETDSIVYDRSIINGKCYFVDDIQIEKFTNKGFNFNNCIYTDFTGCISSGFDNIYYVRKHGKWAVINTEGQLLTNFIFDEIRKSIYGLSAVCLDGKWGFIDETFCIVIPAIYDNVTDYESLDLNNMYDYYIEKEKWILSPNICLPKDTFHGYKYDSDMIWDKFFQAVEQGDKTEIEYWHKKTDEVIDDEYLSIPTPQYNKFLENLIKLRDKALAISKVTVNGNTGVINRCGDILVECIYSSIEISKYCSTIFKAQMRNVPSQFKRLEINLTYNGRCKIDGYLFPKKYNAVRSTKLKDYFLAIRNGRIGLITANGKSVFPCRYERIKIINRKTIILYTRNKSRIVAF